MKKAKKLLLTLIIITAVLLSAFLTAACGCVFFADSADDPQWVDSMASLVQWCIEPQTDYQKSCFDTAMTSVTARQFYHPEKLKVLQDAKFITAVTNCEVVPGNPDKIRFDLEITDRSTPFVGAVGVIGAVIHKEVGYKYISADEKFRDFSVQAGTVNYYDGKLIFTSNNQISHTERADIKTAQVVNIRDNDIHFDLIDSIPNEKGWMVAFADYNEQGFAQLDATGKMTGETYTLPDGYIAYISQERVNGGFGDQGYNREIAVFGAPHMVYTDEKQENILFSHRTPSPNAIINTAYQGYDYFIYNLENDWAAKPVSIVQSRNNRIAYGILSFETMPEYDEKNAPYRYVAYSYTDGKFTHWTPLDETLLPPGFAQKRTEISLRNSGNTISLRRGTPHNDIHYIDMTTGEIIKEYVIVSELNVISQNNNCEIYCSSVQMGNKNKTYTYYRRNQLTNDTADICTTTTPLEFGVDIGWLDNNKFFLMTGTDYKIWDASCADNKPYFRLSDYFAFGDNPQPGLSYRKLLAARYDTPAQSVLFVYQDFENNPDNTVMPAVKVALVTKEGENPYTHTTDMWYSDDKTYRITLDDATTAHLYAYDRNGDIQAYREGTLDLANSVYTKIK